MAEAETACQKWGGSAFIKWEVIHILLNRLLVLNTFFVTTSNFGGAQPPLSKSGRGSSPPCPPGSLPLHGIKGCFNPSEVILVGI